MTIEEFKILDDEQKAQYIFKAEKVAERIDDEYNYQLYKVDKFFAETRVPLNTKSALTIKMYSLKELPVVYAGEVLRMPIVTLDKRVAEKPAPVHTLKKKEKLQ